MTSHVVHVFVIFLLLCGTAFAGDSSVKLGTFMPRSNVEATPDCSRSLEVIELIEIGTRWLLALRFSAVTTTSAIREESFSWATAVAPCAGGPEAC